MTRSGVLGKSELNQVEYNFGSLLSVENKYHLKLGGIGFILTRDIPSARYNYARDQAPAFVNKIGGGEPTYRDGSFFSNWAQINWRNGAKQLEWDDEGRYYTSKNINVTKELKITLAYLLTTLSLTAGSVDITCWEIDYSDSRKVFAGASNGHVWRYSGGSWSDLGDITGANRRVNCLVFSKIGLNGSRAAGAGQIYAGTGTPGGAAGTGKIYRYDGSWTLVKTFAAGDAVTTMCEFNSEMYAAVGGTADIEKASDANLATWATSKDIDYPGYIWAMVVYNQRLYAGGGNPENAPTTYQLGTLWAYDGFTWGEVGPFAGTVVQSLCVYDNLLFIGTIHGQLYVYNRANIDLLYEMPDGTGIFDLKVFDDKLYIAVCYRTATNGEEAVYVFDRAGTSRMHLDSNIKPFSLLVVGDELYVGGKDGGNAYKVDKTKYNSTGEIQSSYNPSNLPNIDKLYFDVSIEMEALPASTKIEIYYKFDEADSGWTKIDETSTTGSKLAVFAFPDGTAGKKLSYRLILSTTAPTSTPTVKKIITRYIIEPDFKYLWKFKVACADNIRWTDNTEPISPLSVSSAVNDVALTLSDTTGFSDPGGEIMYASIDTLDGSGNIVASDEFTFTGLTGNQLTGCQGVAAHDITNTSYVVAIRGRHLHSKIIELKQRKAILQYVDIDTIVYRVLIHDYTEDGWVLNSNALENEVAVTLLQT